MDAVILAGGISKPGDPLFPVSGENYKSLIDIGGKPMVQWVLDAIKGASCIEQVVVMGLPEDVPLSFPRSLIRIPDQGTLVSNIRAGAKALYELGRDPVDHMMTISADVPAITSEMVDWMANTVQGLDVDVVYSVTEKTALEKSFPASKRTYIKVKGMQVCGGDVNAVRMRTALEPMPFFEALTTQRKNPVQQASMIGFGTLFLLVTGRLSLDEAVKRVCKKLGITGKALVNPYPEVGMDVDKPFQLEIMREYLAKRS